ncbi:MAG: NUDIX hydrolase [Gemmatimonadaceae bacterium]
MAKDVAAGEAHPTVLDRGYQLAYRCAYQLMRTYWHVRKPETHGALIALWNDEQVLLVRNSYVKYYSAPGGYVRKTEASRDAAIRELKEEVRLSVRPEELSLVLDVTHDWEGKRDHVEIFEVDVPSRPAIQIDNREVIAATWMSSEQALSLNLFPPLRQAIERHGQRGSA